jgi:hypothetical protein
LNFIAVVISNPKTFLIALLCRTKEKLACELRF